MLFDFWVLGLITKAHYSCGNYLAHTTHLNTTADHVHPYQWQWHYLMAVTLPASGGILQYLAPQDTSRGPFESCGLRGAFPHGPDLLTQTRLTTWAFIFLVQFLRSDGSLSGHTVMHSPSSVGTWHRYMWEGVYMISICIWAVDACHVVSTWMQSPQHFLPKHCSAMSFLSAVFGFKVVADQCRHLRQNYTERSTHSTRKKMCAKIWSKFFQSIVFLTCSGQIFIHYSLKNFTDIFKTWKIK